MADSDVGPKIGRQQWNLGNLPPAGHTDCGWFFRNKVWEIAKDEKLGKLDLHDRWDDLHAQFRGHRKRTKTFPTVGVNYLFKSIKSFCATLTEKHPVAEAQSDDADPMQSKALNEEIKSQWNEQEMQGSLYASSQNFGVYGTAIEKGLFNVKEDTAMVKLLDSYNFFPCPGYKMCNLKLPYVAEAAYLEPWDIRRTYGIPDNVAIPTTPDEDLSGKNRETVRGGKRHRASSKHYNSNFSDTDTEYNKGGKALVVEIWIKDSRMEEVPINEEQVIPDDFGRPIGSETVQTGIWRRAMYPGGIRKVTICPEMDEKYRVLDDAKNPNINWGLVEWRENDLLQNGIAVPAVDEQMNPVIDPNTGQPIKVLEVQEQEGVDPKTGEPIAIPVPIGIMTVSPEEAHKMALESVKKTYLYNRFPYSATPAEIDTSQWWGFSYIEQLEELQGAIQMLLDKYFRFLIRQMFPILINPADSGVDNSKITNEIGLILRPTIATAPQIRYIEPARGPQDILVFIQFLLTQFDMISQSPDVAEGRRPKGVSAASAIVALQDKAASLMTPYIRSIDSLIRGRGRMMISMIQNFGTDEKPIKVDEDVVTLIGIDVHGDFDYVVESGSSAPITKAGRREQYVQLYQLQAMDLESLLEQLEIPKYKTIVERLAEQNSLQGAIDILIQAGLPQDYAVQLYQYLMQPQGGTGRTKEEPNAEGQQPTGPPGGSTGGMQEQFNQMRVGDV